MYGAGGEEREVQQSGVQQLLEQLFSGQIRLPAFSPELIALEQEYPKTDLMALLIFHRRGDATMSELAGDLNVPLSTATGIGARLARRGLIERERSADDRRVILNRLTPEGKAFAGRIQTNLDAIVGRVTTALTPEELTILITLVQKLLRVFQEDPVPLGTALQATESKGLKAAKEAQGKAGKRIPIDD